MLKSWDNDYLIIEHEPLKSIKIMMPLTMNKQLDVHFIYPTPQEDDSGVERCYPNSSIVVKLKSKVMPHDLVEKLLKRSENMVKKLATAEGGGKPQVVPVFEFLRNVMENNNLIPAWDELSEIEGLLRLKPEDEKI